ncbi:MAG: ribosome maturation factor RimM [Enterobacteriaceae bacterium]
MKKIPKDPIIIGKISKKYGNKELFQLFSYFKNKYDIFKYKFLYIKNKKWEIIKLKYCIKKKKKFIIKIKNIKKKLNIFNNKNIFIDFKDIKINQNYYWKDIIKCKVINFNNYKLGKIKNIIETGSNDVIIIKKKKKETIIPFIKKQIIQIIDIKLKIIKVKYFY